MAQNLEDVLQQLQTALVGLNTFLENQNRQVKTQIEQNADINTGATTLDTLRLQTLEEWVEAHDPNKDRLLKIRKGFIDYSQIQRATSTERLEDTLYFTRDYPEQLLNRQTSDNQANKNIWPEQVFYQHKALYKSDSLGYPLFYGGEDKLAPGRIIIHHLDPRKDAIDISTLFLFYNWLENPSNQIDDQFLIDFVRRKAPAKALGINFRLDLYPDILGRVRIAYHLNGCRYETMSRRLQKWHHGMTGVLVEREHAIIRNIGSRYSGGYLLQIKQSFCLEMVQLSDTVAYTLLAIDDTERPNELPVLDKKIWQKYGIVPCGKALGFAQFQAMICLSLDAWGTDWIKVLDEIDGIIHIQYDDTRIYDDWNDLMFVNSSGRSKLYFIVLRLLPMIREWIEEIITDQHALRQGWLQSGRHLGFGLTENELRNIERNWDTIFLKSDLQAKKFISRIDQRIEVKNLRDALFNATSLREAGKGMVLNRAIYVFTVVTVIYTPLGFMATFWALPIVNGSSDGDGLNVSILIGTFVLIPVLTYIISLFAIGYITIESSRRAFNSDNFQRLLNLATGNQPLER